MTLATLLGAVAKADIVVVVNPSNPVSSFSQRELIDLYMGRNLHFPDGSLVLRLDLQPDSQVRQQFYQRLVHKSVAEVNAYWARLLFSGRASPPEEVHNSESVLQAVRAHKNVIGYIDSRYLDDSVKEVGRLE